MSAIDKKEILKAQINDGLYALSKKPPTSSNQIKNLVERSVKRIYGAGIEGINPDYNLGIKKDGSVTVQIFEPVSLRIQPIIFKIKFDK